MNLTRLEFNPSGCWPLMLRHSPVQVSRITGKESRPGWSWSAFVLPNWG